MPEEVSNIISDSSDPFAHQTSKPAYLDSIDKAAQDPSWPPLPTMGGSSGERPNLDGDRIDLRPRAAKLPARRPEATEAASPQEGIPAATRKTSADQAFHVSETETLEFPCPACGLKLATLRGNDNSTPGPCPHCEASIVAPHVVSADPNQTKSAKNKSKGMYRPDRSKASNAPRPSRTISQ